MPREILILLNVEAPDTDTRTEDEIADAILSAINVCADDESVRELKVVVPLAEEV